MIPLFICGTGRSGTTIFTQLLACHPEVWSFRWESQVFSGIPGLGDILLSDFSPELIDQFAERLRGHLFKRNVRGTYDAGLFAIIDEASLSELVRDFREHLRAATDRSSRVGACRILSDGIFRPAAHQTRASIWCEKTPRNLLYADQISEIYPEAKFIHVIRDGRDVLSSMLTKNFWPVARCARYPLTLNFTGPVGFEQAADYWTILLDIAREQEAVVGGDRWLNVRFEDVAAEPEESFRRVFDFLHLAESQATFAGLRRLLNPASAHTERWRQDLTHDQAEHFTTISVRNLRQFDYVTTPV